MCFIMPDKLIMLFQKLDLIQYMYIIILLSQVYVVFLFLFLLFSLLKLNFTNMWVNTLC